MSQTGPPPRPRVSAWWLYGFLLVQFGCQAALILAPVGGLRLGCRAATYISSIALLLLIPLGGRPSPFRGLAAAVIVITALGLLHPDINTLIAGLGSVGMAVAVWGPAFWAARIGLSVAELHRVLILVWGFNAISAVVGVLQVYDPDRFAPDPEFVRQLLGGSADALMINLSDGRRVYRPMGLSDTPGGAASAGSFAILSGLGLMWQTRSLLFRSAVFPVAMVGFFCLYVCQIRATMITTALALLAMIVLQVVRGQLSRAWRTTAIVTAVTMGGFMWASAVGDAAVIDRFISLTTEAPGETYYKHRGFFLEATLVDELPAYPFGAGLGRWGMMYTYFGDSSYPIMHVEVQATAWVYDGGILLLVAGYAATFGAFGMMIRLAVSSRSDQLAGHAVVVAAYALSVIVATSGYPAFIGQMGMMFWVLATALFTVADRSDRTAGGPAR